MKSNAFPPVAFFIFKRPEQTQRVFDVIRQVHPPRLFVIADGPRNEDERLRCEETREIVTGHIDWPCKVDTDFAQTNMGLRKRLVSGITWVFEQVEEAIFLEDDCLPDPTFFRFCAELLDRYRDDPRVMHISGNCFVEAPFLQASYYFTHYAHVWLRMRLAGANAGFLDEVTVTSPLRPGTTLAHQHAEDRE